METSSTTEYVKKLIDDLNKSPFIYDAQVEEYKKNATIEKVVIVIQRDRERERIDDLCTGKKRIEKLRKL